MRRAGALLVGAWVGLLGAVVHRHGTAVAGIDVPWGLGLAVGTTVLVATGAALLVPVGAGWFGMGWAFALAVPQAFADSSGLVGADALGWSYMLLGLGGVGAVVVLAPRLER